MVDGDGVALGAFDGQAEQVDQAADVAVGGLGFVEDAVLADGLAWIHRSSRGSFGRVNVKGAL